jgi:hypothetical protein
MTDRNFGQSSSAARLPLFALVLALTATATARAQDTETPTPAPSSIFRLPPADDGRTPGVQGPSDNGLPPVAPNERRGSQQPTPNPAPTPTPAPPRVTPTQPTTTSPSPAPSPIRRDTAAPDTSRAVPAAPDAASGSSGQSSAALPPLETTTPEVAAPTVAVAPETDATPIAATPGEAPSGTPLWAWILAVLAALGAGLWYWRRRPTLAGPTDDAVIDAPRPAVPPPAPRAATPPAPRPAPASVPAPPTLPAAPRPASPLVNRAAGERRAVVGMALDIRGIRFAPDHVVVAFSLHLINQGILPATGLMVRIALNQGSAMPEAVLGRFFDGAGGSVLRDDMTLDAGAGEELSTEVMLPRTAIEPLMIGGKPMLVPVMALDVTYHWDGEGEAFGQNAGSFVLGRQQGTGPHDKLAPLPLDRAVYQVDRPGARATAIQRTQ